MGILPLSTERATRTSPLIRLLVKLLLKMTQKQKALSKEEELLLQDFSRNVSTKSNALFYGNALIVSAVPIWLYWRIHLMDPLSSSLFLGHYYFEYLLGLICLQKHQIRPQTQGCNQKRRS